MNPDMMPKRWWEDDDYWEAYSIMEIAKMKKVKKEPKTESKKRDWLRDAYEGYLNKGVDINDLIKEEWLFEHEHPYDYEDAHKSKAAKQAGRNWTPRRFKAGQLVQAAFGHPDYSGLRGDVGLVIQKDLEIHGRPTSYLTVKVMWPNGEVTTVSEDNLQSCNPYTEGL